VGEGGGEGGGGWVNSRGLLWKVWGREGVCVEVLRVVFSQSSKAKTGFCVVLAHAALITSNGLSFDVLDREARRDRV